MSNPSFYDEHFANNEANEMPVNMDLPATVPTAYPDVVSSRSYSVGRPSRQSRRMTREADLAVQRENHRADITATVLGNTHMLVRAATQMAEEEPRGEEVYKNIVKTYAITGSMRVSRW